MTSPPPRSDTPLASAERQAESGMTREQALARGRSIAAQRFRTENILMVNLDDHALTQSQYQRALSLGRELYQGVRK